MKERVFVTGGLGYLGGRIVQGLQQESRFEVRVGSRSPERAPAWIGSGAVVPLDMTNDESMRKALHGVSAVVHLAACNEIESARDPELAFQVNTVATLRLLRSAVQTGVKRFVYFSTAHVYGAPLMGVITERTLPRPIHPYAITHRAAEDLVLAAHDARSLCGVVLRLSNGFGAPTHPSVDRWTLLVNDLCRQAVTARSLTLRSSGLQLRDFLPLSDVVRAVIHVLDAETAAMGDGLFNLGAGQALRVHDLALRIADRCESVLGYRPPVHRPTPSPDEKVQPLDFRTDKLLATGFRLSGDMDAEIDGTLRFCKEHFGAKP